MDPDPPPEEPPDPPPEEPPVPPAAAASDSVISVMVSVSTSTIAAGIDSRSISISSSSNFHVARRMIIGRSSGLTMANGRTDPAGTWIVPFAHSLGSATARARSIAMTDSSSPSNCEVAHSCTIDPPDALTIFRIFVRAFAVYGESPNARTYSSSLPLASLSSTTVSI